MKLEGGLSEATIPSTFKKKQIIFLVSIFFFNIKLYGILTFL